MQTTSRKEVQTGQLGTFAGVFTPSVLTILGIILFLRMGFVVGAAGLARALIIIAAANLISVLTSFSLAAIATNLKVKGGGDYYLISRTLGVEFGGALGLVLFLAQSVSIAFYCIGFGEAVAALLTSSAAHIPQMIAACAVGFLFVFAWLGADWAARFQYVVMLILVLALTSFYIGGLSHWNAELLVRNWNAPSGQFNFWMLFALFFPAVTGFTQGVSMSGDLRDPGKSLPRGTFLAVGVSILVYLSVALVFAGALPNDLMTSDYGAMQRVSRWRVFIDAGVIAATLSSAMASFLGAPRILQSLARDRVFAFLTPFAKGAGPLQNPRRGVLLSAAIALATIALGQLDLIARVVSMFFLISYGLLNYATYYEASSASPSFRPRFRWYHHHVSLVGFLACTGVMLAIDLQTGLVAIAILFAIFQYLKRTSGPSRWADSQRSYHLHQVRSNLLAAAASAEHPRDWRPYLLALSDDSERRGQLLRFAACLEGGSGMTSAVRFLMGEGLRMVKLRAEAEEALRKDLASHGSKAFPLVITAPNLQSGLDITLQAFGIGPIHANIILLNWLETSGPLRSIKAAEYVGNLRFAFHRGCNIVVLNAKKGEWRRLLEIPPKERRIDIWWWDNKTGRLMLMLAHLLTHGEGWDGASIRVIAANYETESEENLEKMRGMLEDARIEARCEIVANADAKRMAAVSWESALVFLPLHFKDNQPHDPFGGDLDRLLDQLGVAALVLAAEELDLDAAPEEGPAGELARALDQLERAQRRAQRAQKAAEEAASDAETKVEAIQTDGEIVDDELVTRLHTALQARREAQKAARRAIKEQVKLDNAAQTAEELGAPVAKDQD